MRASGRIGLAALVACAAALAAPAGADGPAPAAADFEACLEHPRFRREEAADGEEEPAFHEDASPGPGLAELCPAVHALIASAPFAQFLPDDWAERPSTGRLAQFREQLAAPAPATAAHRLDPAAVAAILDEIHVAQARREKTLWQRIRDWIEGVLRRQPSEESAWLEDWLRKHAPAQRTMNIVAYVAVSLLVAGAVWIVWRELRAAGLLRRSQGSGRDAAGGRMAAGQAARARTLADASAEELPALLVALVLERLRMLGLVRDSASMTHRELVAAARLAAPEDRAAFAGLVTMSERLRYAAAAPAREQLGAALDAGRALLGRLAAAPRGAT